MTERQEELSVIERLFEKYFQNLKDLPDLEDSIIKKLQEVHERGDLTDPSVFNEFVDWLEEYNAKDKEPKG